MTKEAMNSYVAGLRDEIMKCYLLACTNKMDEEWFLVCQEALRHFVLARPGWTKNEKTEDLFMYHSKYALSVNIMYSGSTGMLLIHTATGIAKAELMDKFDNKDSNATHELPILEIVKCVEGQDWIIPFIQGKR